MSLNLETALKLHDVGVGCIPLDRNKRPNSRKVMKWGQYQKELPDRNLYSSWWSDGDGVGVIAGDIQCLDLDCKYDPKIYDQFIAETNTAGLSDLVNRLVCQTTVNGGYHLIWKQPGSTSGNLKLANREDGEVLIETRGKGGYFQTAADGYRLIRGHLEEAPVLTKDEQESLFRIAQSLDRFKKPEEYLPEPKDEFEGDGFRPGDDYNERGPILELVESYGWHRCGKGDRYWTRPGKERGVSASWNATDLTKNKFRVFSTSTELEAKAYSRFALYAALVHGSDFKEAARELAGLGFGEQKRIPQLAPEIEDSELKKELPELPSPLKEIVEEAVRLYGVDPDLPTLIALSVVSTAMRKSFELSVPPFENFGNIFALLIAISGSGKSLSYKLITKALFDRERSAFKRWKDNESADLQAEFELLTLEKKKLMTGGKDEQRATRKSQLSEINKKLAEIEDRKQPPRLTVEDITTQQLGVLMQANNEVLGLLSSEAGDVISNLFGRNNNADRRTDEHLFLKFFSGGESVKVDRVSRGPIMLENPIMTLCLITTPDELRGLFGNQRFVLGGLLPRFLICESKSIPARDDGTIREPDLRVRQLWGKCINDIIDADGESIRVSLSKEAHEVFRNYGNEYVELIKQIPDGASFNARRREIAQRVALVLHVTQFGVKAGDETLAAHTAQAGCDLSESYGRSHLKFIKDARRAADSKEIAKIIEVARKHDDCNAEGSYVVSLRDVRRGKKIQPERVEELANSYPDQLKIETRNSSSVGGRPSKVVIVK